MAWHDQQVLVTGAGGFIASHLIERLVSTGTHVRAFVRYNSRGDIGLLRLLPEDVLAQIEVVMGDLRDTDAVRAALRNVDTVFHLGALIAIPYSYIHPREVVETNVMGTLNILIAARELGTSRIVHTSTSEVYGTAQYVPIDERHPFQGQSPYAASKIAADKIVESFHRSYALPVTTLRPFNTYGPRQSARAVIPTIISQALAGDYVRLGNLEPSRDFTFVHDTVDGFLRIATSTAALGQEINIGNGATITVGDLADKIFSLMGKKPRLITDQQRQRPPDSEVLKLYASNRKAANLMGWEPRTSLEAGLQETIDWITSHLEFYHPQQYTV